MARETYRFQVTIPTTATKAAPYKLAIPIPTRKIVQVRVRVPPGPNGTMGFAIGSAGVPVLPINAGAWIVANDETIPWEINGYVTSGTWWVLGYNTGNYTHTIGVMLTATLTGTTPAGSKALPPTTLSTVAPQTTAKTTTGTFGTFTIGTPGAVATPPEVDTTVGGVPIPVAPTL